MNFLVTGGSGFIGRNLVRVLLDRGHDVVAVGSSPEIKIPTNDRLTYISADTTRPGNWTEETGAADVIVNLTGRSILSRWTSSYKKQLYDSRILTTKNIVSALEKGSKSVLINASAAGFYGDRGDEPLYEDSSAGTGFLAELAKAWENEAGSAAARGVRTIIARFGIVLGKDGGALEKMLPAYRLFLGGSLGDGRQWFPWIHIQDLIDAILFILENDNISGSVNICAPEPVRYSELAATMGELLKRPSFFSTPGFFLRMALGEMASTLLASQRMIPGLLLQHGFRFRFPAIKDALGDLLGNGKQ